MHFVSFSTQHLPLQASLCHCKICRQATGQLWASWAVIPSGCALPSLEGLSSHQHELKQQDGTTKTGIKRYFCAICGATVLNDEVEDWEIATGIVDEVCFTRVGGQENRQKTVDGVFDRVELWASSPEDGGGAIWLYGGKSEGKERYLEGRSSAILNDQDLDRWQAFSSGRSLTGHDYVRGSCACGSIGLTYNLSNHKDSAILCACTSCRKTSGFDISAWTKSRKADVKINGEHLFDRDGQTLLKKTAERMGLSYYSSSTNISRLFCGKCGCKVLYFKDDWKQCDINPGIFAHANGEGARCESWLDWYPEGRQPVGFMEDAIDVEYVKDLAEGVSKEKRRRGLTG